MGIVRTLAANPKNEVVIISGRDRHTLTQWLGQLNVNLVAEHGAFMGYPRDFFRAPAGKRVSRVSRESASTSGELKGAACTC